MVRIDTTHKLQKHFLGAPRKKFKISFFLHHPTLGTAQNVLLWTFLVLQLVTNRELVSVPSRANQYVEGPQKENKSPPGPQYSYCGPSRYWLAFWDTDMNKLKNQKRYLEKHFVLRVLLRSRQDWCKRPILRVWLLALHPLFLCWLLPLGKAINVSFYFFLSALCYSISL